MSSLIVCHDLHIMMLELSVAKLLVPDSHVFDAVTLRKTTIMFRMLDNNWIELQPQQQNYRQYNGSNSEVENFYGGKSVVFAISEGCLKHGTSNANIKIHVFKEISKYFELESCYDAGVTYIDIHSLFYGIVKELRERKNMYKYFTYFHEREPISKSMKGTFTLVNESNLSKSASMDAYIRLSYFGKSIITEFDRSPEGQFHVSEERYEGIPYQCLELTREKLENGCWGESRIVRPLTSQGVVCECTGDEHDGRKVVIPRSSPEAVVRASQYSTIEMKSIRAGKDGGAGRGDFQNLQKTSPISPTARNTTMDIFKKLDRKTKREKKKTVKNQTTDEFDGIGDGVRGDRDRQDQKRVDREGPDWEGQDQERQVRRGQDRERSNRGRTLPDERKSRKQKRFDSNDLEDRGINLKKNPEVTNKSKDKWNREDPNHGDTERNTGKKNRRRLRGELESDDAELIDDRTRKAGILKISDARKRKYLKGTATGVVTIGLNEKRMRKYSKISTSISRCKAKALAYSRCACLMECQIACPVVMCYDRN